MIRIVCDRCGLTIGKRIDPDNINVLAHEYSTVKIDCETFHMCPTCSKEFSRHDEVLINGLNEQRKKWIFAGISQDGQSPEKE